MKNILISTFILVSVSALGQSIEGQWKTIDDNSGKARSVVEIYKRGDLYFGKVLKTFPQPGEDPDPICDECDEDDPRYGQKVIGMEIIKDMKYDERNNEYEDGEILDPENGNIYDCKIWLEDGNLKLRGYIMFLYRTQTWLPYSE